MSMSVYHSIMKVVAPVYQRVVATELNKMGLRYEDLLNSSSPDIGEALELADPAVKQGRQRRLKRASDLSFKAKNLQEYAPGMKLEPFKEELWQDVLKIQARNEEIAQLNAHKL
ncbi:expressed unknown protein [Seminavis robusta]|uniref:Cytochrome b-c1 complex subunit 7 n=1 Tax=Seminavis robusta TaxID=568900 RepID=A0A9N8HEN1_9STRA|nr:expressed unknown protein [Seminavis robusta]|eukprot:Sro311_g114390.1 n/a (114) ;mRNA; f:63713-64282